MFLCTSICIFRTHVLFTVSQDHLSTDSELSSRRGSDDSLIVNINTKVCLQLTDSSFDYFQWHTVGSPLTCPYFTGEGGSVQWNV
jgi:hypothetical protein